MLASRYTLLLALSCVAPTALRAQAATTAVLDQVGVRIQSFSVVVPEYEPAKQWYTEKLGFVVTMDQPIPGGDRFLMVAPPGQTDFGIVLQRSVSRSTADEQMPDYSDRIGKAVNVVLRVTDVTRYARMIERNGVALTSGPTSMPWGAQATFRDLFGNTFVVMGPAGGARQ